MGQMSKNVTTFFDEVVAGVEDQLVFADAVTMDKNTDIQELERNNYVKWYPKPVRMIDHQGTSQVDLTDKFATPNDSLIPVRVNIHNANGFELTATELNDPMRRERYKNACIAQLAGRFNQNTINAIVQQGALSVKRGTLTGYDDVALVNQYLRERGYGNLESFLGVIPESENILAKDVAKRENFDGEVSKAYKEAYINRVARVNLLSSDYTLRLTANGASGVTVNGANQRFTPVPSSSGLNVDSRIQQLAITVSSGTVAVGSRFTIAGVFAVNQASPDRTVQDQLQTFVVTRIVSGAGGTGTIEISPPIICDDGTPTLTDRTEKNCSATPANGAAITFLNTTTKNVCPIWTKDSIIVTPASYSIDNGGGLLQATSSIKQGLSIQMFTSNGTVEKPTNKYRFDMFYGINNLSPETTGAMLVNQS